MKELYCEYVSTKASWTGCLSLLRDSKFEACSFSVTLRVVFTVRDVIRH